MNPAGVFKRLCALSELFDKASLDLDCEDWDVLLARWDEALALVEELRGPMEIMRRQRGNKRGKRRDRGYSCYKCGTAARMSEDRFDCPSHALNGSFCSMDHGHFLCEGCGPEAGCPEEKKMNDCQRLFENWWAENKPENATEEDEKRYWDCWTRSWTYSLGGVIT